MRAAGLMHASLQARHHLRRVDVDEVVVRQREDELGRRALPGTCVELAAQALRRPGERPAADVGQHQHQGASGSEPDAVIATQVLAQAGADIVKRTALLRQATRAIADDVPAIFMVMPAAYGVTNAKIRGITGENSLMRIYDGVYKVD